MKEVPLVLMYTELTIVNNNEIKKPEHMFHLGQHLKINILYNPICVTGANLRRPVAMLKHPEVNLINLGGTR